jgi:hypothetical protein
MREMYKYRHHTECLGRHYAVNILNFLQFFIDLCYTDRYVLLGSSHGSLSGSDNLGATAAMMEVARVFSMLNSKKGIGIQLYWYCTYECNIIDFMA